MIHLDSVTQSLAQKDFAKQSYCQFANEPILDRFKVPDLAYGSEQAVEEVVTEINQRRRNRTG